MKFERHKKNPLDSLQIGYFTDIEYIEYGWQYVSETNISRVLKAVENGDFKKWTAGSKNFFLTKWEFKQSGIEASKTLKEFAGMRIRIGNDFFRIPEEIKLSDY